MYKVLGLLALAAPGLASMRDYIPAKYLKQPHLDIVHARDLEARHNDGGDHKGNSSAGSRFLNDQTKPFHVPSLPDINVDLVEMYSGLIPIDTNNKTDGELFFVFQPKTSGDPVDEVTIWFNGGPGCSSLEAWFQENGHFQWLPGTREATLNNFAWSNLTNMLYVEQPKGVGFSTGPLGYYTNEEDVAQDFIKFFKNWQDTFGIKNYKI